MKRPIRNRIAAGVVALAASAAAAESPRLPLPPAYVEECGSCHVAFPGRMLDAASWGAVIAGLDQHFGVDASVDPKTLEPIRAYLASSARSRPTTNAGAPALRITETRWFRHEHDEVPGRLRNEPNAVKPSDCSACHRSAAEGSYSERSLRLPEKGATK
jgi:hypothetical protein